MFSYSNLVDVLPSLIFTKAELVYALTRLMKDLDDNDNSTRIEMVELRHYLNLIRSEVVAAACNRELSLSPKKIPQAEPRPKDTRERADIAHLKSQFPNLTEQEIREVLSAPLPTPKEEAPRQPPPPERDFILSTNPNPTPSSSPPQNPQKENSEKFARLLGF